MKFEDVIEIAKRVRKNAYAPYSNYYVGCALKCKSGNIYSGCNIENLGIQSICAERVAFAKAISEGEKEFEYIIVCGGASLNNLENATPCGYCRQFISEFVDEKFRVYVVSENNKITEYSIVELLPDRFKINK